MELTIGELARRAGVAPSAIRYYEELGLLPRPARAGGRRVFDEQTLDRLRVIAFAKEAGFTLREIRQLFTGFASATPAGARWQKLATSKLAEVEALAARIETVKELLREALRCGCVDLDACGQLFRERGQSPATSPVIRQRSPSLLKPAR
ncbi:MAG TPA: MerR family transcriptional regulator [Thermoanaerobaculia bacterium]|nr:MerR family transcriptional regulator [Thermoanaerobaculia bacterium]